MLIKREWKREERGDTKHKKSVIAGGFKSFSSLLDDAGCIMEAGRQFDAQERKQLKRVEKAMKALPGIDQIWRILKTL
jgi:hypothetical protein